MAAEVGHQPNRLYASQAGDFHLNGANLWDQGELAFAQVITLTPAAGSGGSNQCTVTVPGQDGTGTASGRAFGLDWYLSDSATGNGLTATAPSTSAGAGSAGTDLLVKVAKKATDVLTDNTGKYVLAIVDTAKTGYYVCVFCPGTGNIFVSAQLQTSNYG
jgi:hypothetical protein